MQTQLLIFGFGYTAYHLAQCLEQEAFSIIGTSRKISSTKRCRSPNYTLIPFNEKAIDLALQKTTHLLVSAPPTDGHGDPMLYQLQHILKKYSKKIAWVGYLSSTGVYGNHQGCWVNEESKFIQVGNKGRIRIKAERDWIRFSKKHQFPLHLFRLSGIYGPHNNPLTKINQGKSFSIYKPEHYFSRIHVDDIAQVIMQSMRQPNPFSIYNVADDLPAPSHEVDAFAAGLLGLPRPDLIPFAKAKMSSVLKDFYAHNRKILNNKIKKELSITLKYPNYKMGLEALFHQENY